MASFGLPYAYYQFPEGTEQAPPFVCFYLSGSDDLYADRTNYLKIRELAVELYTDNKDYASEQVIEAALNNAGLTFQEEETYLDSERMYLHTYITQIIFKSEE